jgi:ribosome recycling factor
VKPFLFEQAPTNSLLEQVEEVTKKYVKSVDETCKQREKEILGG